MTSLPCSALPRTLNFVLFVLAWLALPMWAVAVWSLWWHDDDGSMLADTAAAVFTFGLFAAFFAARVDKFAIGPAQEREQALVTVIDRLSDAPTPPRRSVRAVR